MKEELQKVLLELEKYVSDKKYKGYDPYDGMRSKILNYIPLPGKYTKIAWIQFFKLFPINLRPLFLISKGINPKGMGLFLSSYTNLYRATNDEIWKVKAINIANWLISNSSKNFSEYCWGYNFDWQSRSFFVPRDTPTIVNTSFIGHAFLDLFEITKNDEYLNICESSCDFIFNRLNRYETNNQTCFSYTPIDNTKIHNASILGTGLLARYFKTISSDEYDSLIYKATNYLLHHQHNDGAWVYAETDYQGWIDSFHTGFNLFSLRYIQEKLNQKEIAHSIDIGEDYYRKNFFLQDGAPKYYNNKTYPLDIHSSSMALAYFSNNNVNNENLSDKIYSWMNNNMRDKSGYYYFRKTKLFNNKISYMRWVQAWALYGLSKYFLWKQ